MWRKMRRQQKNLVDGVTGFYQIDLSMAPSKRDRNWDAVQVTWSKDTNSFTWTNKAGVSWSLKPVSGMGGFDTTKLLVGNENPYFRDGYTSAKIEWVSFLV